MSAIKVPTSGYERWKELQLLDARELGWIQLIFYNNFYNIYLGDR